MDEPTLYVCKNPACPLGSFQQLGKFTGGMTASSFHRLTGMPFDLLKEGVHYGEGFCPNCVVLVEGKPYPVKGEPYSIDKATQSALDDAKARHADEIATIEEGVL